MPLTPEDIQLVQFKKPKFGQRGYDVQQVDEFLDKVAATLQALYARIAELDGTAAKQDPTLPF
ncbi:DivIVA domain-containing protein [Nocardia goodfellowii]